MTQQETLEHKRQEAIKYLGEKWVLHPMYRPRLPQHASTLEMRRPWWARVRGVE